MRTLNKSPLDVPVASKIYEQLTPTRHNEFLGKLIGISQSVL